MLPRRSTRTCFARAASFLAFAAITFSSSSTDSPFYRVIVLSCSYTTRWLLATAISLFFLCSFSVRTVFPSSVTHAHACRVACQHTYPTPPRQVEGVLAGGAWPPAADTAPWLFRDWAAWAVPPAPAGADAADDASATAVASATADGGWEKCQRLDQA